MNMIRNWLKVAGIVVVVLFAAGAVMAQPLSAPQQKLLAKRAAQVDAYRKLAEIVKGFRIDSQTYVRDFVAESDQIKTSFNNFIKGARVAGMPRYLPDGTCELDVEMTVQAIVTALTEIARHNSFGHKYKFNQMTQYVQEKIIRATGTGVPRDDAYPAATQYQPMSSVTFGIPGWEDVTARGRLMAERAALVDAYRNLAETVKGIRISGQTYVRDFVAESDYVQTSLDTFVKGARIVGPYRYLPGGEVEVDIEVTVQQVVRQLNTVRQHLVQKGWGWRRDIFRTVNFNNIVTVYPKKVVRATGNGIVPPKYRNAAMPGTAAAVSMPPWAAGVVSAVGTGVPPEGVTGTEAKLMAVRAAELDAKRQLAEKVYGVHIDARTTVRDFVVQHDMVRADVDTYMAGAIVGEPRYLSDGSVEVTVDLPLDGLVNVIR